MCGIKLVRGCVSVLPLYLRATMWDTGIGALRITASGQGGLLLRLRPRHGQMAGRDVMASWMQDVLKSYSPTTGPGTPRY